MKNTRISRRSVDALQPKEKKYYAWDTQLAGFGVKVLPSGRKSFVYKYRVSGGRAGVSREPVIGADGAVTPDQARKIAQTWAAKVALGEDPGGQRQLDREDERMIDLFARYLSDHAELHKKPSSVREDRTMISDILTAAFGRMRVKDIALADVTRWHSKLAATPYRANRALSLLSKALNLAEVWGLRPMNSNPCRHVKKFKEEKRERFLSAGEFQRLFAALDQAEKGQLVTPKGSKISLVAIAAIRLIIFTGARRTEILGLKWDWVDIENGTAVLPDSKTGRRTIYLSPDACKVLRGIARFGDNPFVFPGTKSGTHIVDVKKPWDLIRQSAGLADVRLHDLRHSFASVGAAAGMSLPQIGALLGHASPQTTARYAHLADQVQHQSAAKISARIKDGAGSDN